MIGGGEGFHDTADDRSGTACLLIIVTAGGWKVLKEVKSKAVFFKLDEIREAIRTNNRPTPLNIFYLRFCIKKGF